MTKKSRISFLGLLALSPKYLREESKPHKLAERASVTASVELAPYYERRASSLMQNALLSDALGSKCLSFASIL
jgi:hypothetical protein